MREVYAKPLADGSPAGRSRLSGLLLTDADKYAGRAADQFVVLVGALEAAEEAGSLSRGAAACKALAAAFAVDTIGVQLELLTKLRGADSPPAAATEDVAAGLALVSDLAAADALPEATRLLESLRATPLPGPLLRKVAANRGRDLGYLRGLRDALPDLQASLRQHPDDARAAAGLGWSHCLARNDWASGLPYLARGPGALKAAALADLARRPSDPEGDKAAGDAWMTAADADSVGGLPQTAMRRGYAAAAGSGKLDGLALAAAQRRLAETVDRIEWADAVDLRPTMPADEDLRTESEGTIALPRKATLQTADSFRGPVAFRVQLMTDGTDTRLRYAAKWIIFNWEGHKDELRIDGGPAGGRNKSGAGLLPANEWTTLDLIVRPDEMVISVDRVERQHVKADFSSVDQPFAIVPIRGDLRVKSVYARVPD